MKKKMQLTQREFDQFEDYLRHDEREESTIEAYLRSLTRFAEWADGRAVTKELAMEWKTALSESGYRPISVNAMLAAVNKFFTCMGREDCKVKYLKPAADVPKIRKGPVQGGVSAPGPGGP